VKNNTVCKLLANKLTVYLVGTKIMGKGIEAREMGCRRDGTDGNGVLMR